MAKGHRPNEVPINSTDSHGNVRIKGLSVFVVVTGLVWLLRSIDRMRLRRTLELSKLVAKSSVVSARSRLMGLLGTRSTDARFEEEAALVAETLGQMKGVMMKLGQMASYIDEGMPKNVRQALSSLQQDAPPMEGRLAIEVIEQELGSRLRLHFRDFDEVPVAAASIGQVHRAVTRAGAEVAVKVQYPGIADVIRADLDNTAMLGSILGMVFSGLDPKPLVGELRSRITEELDYRQEAKNQQVFVDFYSGHPHVLIPGVHHDLSARPCSHHRLRERHPIRSSGDCSRSGKPRSHGGDHLQVRVSRDVQDSGVQR